MHRRPYPRRRERPALLSDLNTVLSEAPRSALGDGNSLKARGGPGHRGRRSRPRSRTRASTCGPEQRPHNPPAHDRTDGPGHRQDLAELGGMTSADIRLTLQYADLNQPQTITAPTAEAVQPVPSQGRRVPPVDSRARRVADSGGVERGADRRREAPPAPARPADVSSTASASRRPAGTSKKSRSARRCSSSGG